MTSTAATDVAVRPGRTIKTGNVPTARVAPILDKLIKDRWPPSYEDVLDTVISTGQAILADKVGCDTTTITKIIAQENAGADFDLVDRLFCALGRPDVWRGELLDVYEETRLLEKCRHERTPENTATDGGCRICTRAAEKRWRESRTPQQRAARLEYQRAWRQRRKAVTA